MLLFMQLACIGQPWWGSHEEAEQVRVDREDRAAMDSFDGC